MDHNPYAPPASNTEVRVEAPPPDGPVGLSGWLILVCIQLIASPIRLVTYVSQTYPPLFRDGTWEKLTTPGPLPYHPFWGPLLISEVVVNLVFIGVGIVLLVLFFNKSWRFPRVYVTFLVSNLAFITVDALAVKIVVPEIPLLDGDTMREFLRSVVAAMIWIPYVLSSKRVKNTFVRTEEQP